jgi:hypothetical protein
MKVISGAEAIARMRQLGGDESSHFELHHLTLDLNRDKSDGMHSVMRARLRPSLPEDLFKTDSDLYLPYTDLDTNEPRMCFKRLIRLVAFPPDFELLKVDWFLNF